MAKRRSPVTKQTPTKRQLARWQRERRRQRIALILAAVFVALVVAVLAYGYYVNDIAPPRQTVTKVGNKDFSLDYVAQRLILHYEEALLKGENPDLAREMPKLMDAIEEDELLLQAAPTLGFEAAREEIDAEISRRLPAATPGSPGGNPTDGTRAGGGAYVQVLTNTGFPEGEYRRIAEAQVLRGKLSDYLLKDLPAVADQVRVQGILVDTEAEAAALKAKIDSGEDFASLARGNSLDTLTRDLGGNMGWMPKGIMAPEFDAVVFSLEPQAVSIPIATPEGFYLAQVLEKEQARAIPKSQQDGLKDRVFQTWILRQAKAKGVQRSWDSQRFTWAVGKLSSYLKAKWQ